jgi:tetratricopeptide (TPR) repeat protein
MGAILKNVMGKLKFVIPLVLLAACAAWAVPAILQAMPSRYVARLPEPLQQLGQPPEQAPTLPTVAAPVSAQALLGGAAPVMTAGKRTAGAAPLSPTPPPTAVPAGATAVATAPPAPSPTPPPTPTPWPLPNAARLEGVRHKFQSWNNCGPATLAMALTYFNVNVTQEETAAFLKPDPEDRNVSPHEMAAYVNTQTPYRALFRANGEAETLRRFVAHGIPVIVEIGIEPPGEYRWMGWYGHYLLMVAYDDSLEQFWVYDSWFGTSAEPLQNAHPDGRILTYAELETYWPHFNRNYIALYRPEQAGLVAEIIGPDQDDEPMWRRALARVQAETAQAPENPFFWFNLGTIYNALGQPAEAAAAFDQALAIGLPWRMLWYQFGPYEAYYATGRYADVLLLADVTLQNRPYFEESFYYKGLAHAALGDARSARANLEKALAFNPNFTPAAIALADLEE